MVAVRSDRHRQGRLALTASVVSGVQRDAGKPGRPFPNFWRPACSFAFGIFGIFGFLELGGIPGRAGRQALVVRVLVPLLVQSSDFSAPQRPLLCVPGSRGRVPGLGLPAPRAAPAPESVGPAPRFVGSSGAAAADPSLLVGNRFRPGPTLPESASIAAAVLFSSLLHPLTDATGPGGPVGVSTPSKWIRGSPGNSCCRMH